MKIAPPLEQGQLQKRYKRFFTDITLQDGSTFTVHCPNTGSMKNCLVPGSPCWFSRNDDPKRKLKGTLEITTTPNGHLVGVNTGRPNQLVKEAIESGVITQLQGYNNLKTEVRYGEEKSRIDILLSNPQKATNSSNINRNDADELCYVEVKNVTLEDDNREGLLRFPDAVTSRGTKHLRELQLMVNQGHRAVLVFCVQHSNALHVEVAADIDPVYAEALKTAMAAGVEVLCYACRLSADEIVIDRHLSFDTSV